DPVVVGDREMSQAATCRSPDEGRRRRERVEGSPGVRVKIRERTAHGTPRSPVIGLDLGDERLLEEVEVLEREAGPDRDAVERVLRDVARNAGHLGQELVDVAEQRPTAR